MRSMVLKVGDLVFVDTISAHGICFLVTNNVRDYASFSHQAARTNYDDGLFKRC